ncbi:MAG TPA: Mov34/MPN/PAD-1 family protein [Anaerolineae bacterium]|nr:Mov34/MPN/PAD-1 family protein [Anaerolineae bacterium]
MSLTSTSYEDNIDSTEDTDGVTVHNSSQQVERDKLPHQEPPWNRYTHWQYGHLPQHQPRTLIHQTALAQLQAHANSDLNVELGGVLLGHAYQHNGQLFTEVLAALPATSEDNGPVHFTFTGDAWSQIHQDKAAYYPKLAIVGWFHTHPDLGVFYSNDDVVVHSAAFVLPWHVGIVIDPCRQDMGLFGWHNETIIPLDGCYELGDQQAEPSLPWQFVATQVWGPMTTITDWVPTYQPEQLGLLLPPWLVPLTVMSIIVMLFMIILNQNSRVNQLESLTVALATQQQTLASNQDCALSQLQIIFPLAGQTLIGNQTETVMATMQYPGAARYQLELSAEPDGPWQLIDSVRRPAELRAIGQWATQNYSAGNYWLRLTAVDSNGEPLPIFPPTPAGTTQLQVPKDIAHCTIPVKLGP